MTLEEYEQMKSQIRMMTQEITQLKETVKLLSEKSVSGNEKTRRRKHTGMKQEAPYVNIERSIIKEYRKSHLEALCKGVFRNMR